MEKLVGQVKVFESYWLKTLGPRLEKKQTQRKQL